MDTDFNQNYSVTLERALNSSSIKLIEDIADIEKKACYFCGQDAIRRRSVVFDGNRQKACDICFTPFLEMENAVWIQLKLQSKKEARYKARKEKKRKKEIALKKRKSNPYTNKKLCNICNQWISKGFLKQHKTSKKHAINLFKEIEKTKE